VLLSLYNLCLLNMGGRARAVVPLQFVLYRGGGELVLFSLYNLCCIGGGGLVLLSLYNLCCIGGGGAFLWVAKYKKLRIVFNIQGAGTLCGILQRRVCMLDESGDKAKSKYGTVPTGIMYNLNFK
jgi:hypothetical protein